MSDSLFWVVWLGLMVLYVASFWKVFEKAGQPGWAAIVPIYNMVVMLRIAGRPGWWLVLLLIPLVNIAVAIVVMIGIAERFGRSAAFGIGLALLGLIFWPILAFGDAEYEGATARAG
jgi:hypothetical protein